MKNSLRFLALAGFALCALLSTSCSKDEKKEAPVIGTYSVDEKSYDIKYAYFTQEGDRYMFGLSDSNELSAGNKHWIMFHLFKSKLNTDIEFNGEPDEEFSSFLLSINGRTYIGDSNYPGGGTSGNMKIIDKGNNTFKVSINIVIDEKEVVCNIETKFTKIPFELITGLGTL